MLAGIETQPLAYTQGDPVTPVTATITVSDAGNPLLAGATVWIGGNYQSGEDLLAFTDTANVTGTWNSITGTDPRGQRHAGRLPAALQAVTYLDTSDDPSTATRTVSFQVDDGLAESNVITRKITVTPIATWNGNASGNLSDSANWVSGVGAGSGRRRSGSRRANGHSTGQRFSGRQPVQQRGARGRLHAFGQCGGVGRDANQRCGQNHLSLPLALGDAGTIQVLAGALTIDGPIDNAGYLLSVAVAAARRRRSTGPSSARAA